MSTQTLFQGSPRPTRIPAITVVHPGLQVHSINAPRTDRRLSLLMSGALYCALAAGAVLIAQASPAIHIARITTDPERLLVELRPREPMPPPIAPVAPTLPSNLQSNPGVAQTITEPQPIENTDVTPTSTGDHNLSEHIAATSTLPNGRNALVWTPPGTGPFGPPSAQPVEVTANAVSVLHQIQPIYPNLARMAHKEGDVVLIMTIDELGVPTEVRMDSGDVVFKNDAIRAAQQWRFTSARFDGKPHSARFRLTLQFRLRG